MWYFSLAIPTLFIMLIITASFFSLPRLSINRNRFFVELIVIETATVIFDIVSSWVDMNYELFSLWTLNIVNLLYFICFFARAIVMHRFNVGVLGVNRHTSETVKNLIRGPFYIGVLLSLLSPFFGFIYSIDDKGYHSGPLYNWLYFCGFYFIAFSIYIMFKYMHRLVRRRERYSLIIYNLLIPAGLLFRLFMPRYLLMDMFVLMAIIVVYLSCENPEFYLDLRSVVFNSRALREYLEEHLGHFEHICLCVVVHKYYEMRDIYGVPQADSGLNMIGRYLKQTFPKCYIFYFRKGRFVILGDRDTDIKEMSRLISDRFKLPWKSTEAELYWDVGFAEMELSNDIESADVIINTMTKAFATADDIDGSTPVEITNRDLVLTEREMLVKRCLEASIENDSIELYLQPLIDSHTGRIVGAEALARIRDDKGKIIPPSEFISIAENSGRINELGEQIFEKTCRFISSTDLDLLGVEWINVNLSPIQFMRRDLAERYSGLIDQYGIDPDKIHLEITEEALVDDVFLKKQIQKMESKGFKFVLDDYGTGYSNLSRLKKCPFINIKLDMSLVKDYCREPDDILPTMIQAFKHMGFGITSEGVENNDMAGMMKKIGCDYLQGYFYSEPVPSENFVKLYSER